LHAQLHSRQYIARGHFKAAAARGQTSGDAASCKTGHIAAESKNIQPIGSRYA
jgi:hypothetical protein